MKRAIIIGVLLVSYFQIQAQKIGVVAGVNFNKPTEKTDYSSTFQYGLGYQVGIKTVFSINDKIEVSPQLLFLSTHAKIKGANLINPNTPYLRLPILLHYKVSPKVTIQAGPSINYSLQKAENGVKNLLVSGMVGLGFQLTEDIELNAQYSHSLYNEIDKGIDGKVSHSMFMFSMAYYFKK